MRQIVLSKPVEKFLKTPPPKQQRQQVVLKIMALKAEVLGADTKKLIDYHYYRVDCGEYRIVYDWSDSTVYIRVVDRRNDSDVYRRLERL